MSRRIPLILILSLLTLNVTNSPIETPVSLDPTLLRTFWASHGILLTICWCFLADIGILFRFMRGLPYNVLLHIFCFVLAITGTVVSGVQFIKKFGSFDEIVPLAQTLQGNVIPVLVLISLLVLQLLVGVLFFVLYNLNNCNPRLLRFFRISHKYLGYGIILLAKAEVINGWILYNDVFTLTILATEVALVLTFFLVYLWKGSLIARELRAYEVVNRPLTPEQNVLCNLIGSDLPYNSLVLRQFNFFTFNDMVYVYKSSSFHPGGRKIIDRVRGREVDRFIYGIHVLEEYPGLTRVLHPDNCFDMLEKPLYKMEKNPTVQLPTDRFVVSRTIDVSPSVSLFQFLPARGEGIIYMSPTNLRHLGQYFKVTGFGFTRLYTCILAFTSENRLKNQDMFNILGVTPIEYRPLDRQMANLEHNDTFMGRNTTRMFGHGLVPADTLVNLTAVSIHKTQLYIDQRQALPLLIKRYAGNTFTSKLFSHPEQKLRIYGLKGRSMGVERLNRGRVLLMAGGTGFYPFIDLVNVVFSVVVGDRTKTACIPQHRAILEGLRFTLFGSFDSVYDIGIPTQLGVLAALQSPMFSMMLNISKPLAHKQISLLGPYLRDFRFDEDFAKRHVLSIPEYELSMVYICGPPLMCCSILGTLRKFGVPEDKIFLL